jgi:ATP-dependent RNA helicase RhlE
MGFIHDVKKIIAELPKVRQNLLFSATMPEEIASLTKSLLKNPITIEVTPVASTSDQISQTVYFVERNDKRKLLLSLIQEQNIERAIVFTRTKAIANRVTGYLDDSGISAEAIHGNKSQNARQRALENFREGKTRILVASDLAARGLDVDLITHVFNYDLPNIPETYVHRIGRTGRAEAVGQAISFCDFEERLFLRQIEKVIGKSIPVIRDHPFASSGQAAGRDGSGNSGARPQGQHQSSRQGGQRPQARREPSPRHPSSATPRPSHGGSKGPNNAGRRSTNSDKTQKR